MTDKELIESRSLTIDHIHCLIAEQEFFKIGKKTTICLLTLKTGFEVVGTSGVVDPKKFDFEIGKEIARKNAVEKIWEIEGYRLQSLIG